MFLFVNFPANSLIDRRGMRVSLCLGIGLYFAGFGMYLLINVHYYMVIIGTLLMGIGQPFLINLPAKIALLWFYPKNVLFLQFRQLLQLLPWSAVTFSVLE